MIYSVGRPIGMKRLLEDIGVWRLELRHSIAYM